MLAELHDAVQLELFKSGIGGKSKKFAPVTLISFTGFHWPVKSVAILKYQHDFNALSSD